MNARRKAGIKLWTPWRHIGRGSGEFTFGRVCLSIYTEQTPQLRYGSRPGNKRMTGHMWFRAFHLWVGPLLFMVRRWR